MGLKNRPAFIGEQQARNTQCDQLSNDRINGTRFWLKLKEKSLSICYPVNEKWPVEIKSVEYDATSEQNLGLQKCYETNQLKNSFRCVEVFNSTLCEPQLSLNITTFLLTDI